VRGQISQPLRVGHVALAARHRPNIGGLHQHDVQLLGQNVEERAPVVAGRLQHHQLHPIGDELLPQLQDRGHRRRPGRHPRRGLRRPTPLDPDAHLPIAFADVDARTTLSNHIHRNHPQDPSRWPVAIAATWVLGRAGDQQDFDSRARWLHSMALARDARRRALRFQVNDRAQGSTLVTDSTRTHTGSLHSPCHRYQSRTRPGTQPAPGRHFHGFMAVRGRDSYFDLKKSGRVSQSKPDLTRENGPKPLG